jgi:hypothetical protein
MFTASFSKLKRAPCCTTTRCWASNSAKNLMPATATRLVVQLVVKLVVKLAVKLVVKVVKLVGES